MAQRKSGTIWPDPQLEAGSTVAILQKVDPRPIEGGYDGINGRALPADFTVLRFEAIERLKVDD